jgi:arylsulfatase A-like enzyme
LPKAKVTKQPAITMDLTATILVACGASPVRKLDGVDLLPLLRGEQPPLERTFYWRVGRTDRFQKAVRQGKWKFVLDGQLPMLFDLENDVGERVDLGYRNPDKLRELQALHAAWEQEMDASPTTMRVR